MFGLVFLTTDGSVPALIEEGSEYRVDCLVLGVEELAVLGGQKPFTCLCSMRSDRRYSDALSMLKDC